MSERLSPNFHLAAPDTDVYVGDCRDILEKLSHQGVKPDLIFADPPFNYDQDYVGFNDKVGKGAYVLWTGDWIAHVKQIVSGRGSVWLHLPDEWVIEAHQAMDDFPAFARINWCNWHFRFGQCRDSNFIVSKTHLLYFARDRKHRTWNPDAVLEPSDRAAKYNDPRTRRTRRPGKRVPFDVWSGPGFGRIQGNNKERVAECPNQMPEAILRRIILACSNPGDLVLDPFLGSGTTCAMARALGRRSIGIEISEATARRAFDRIEEVVKIRSTKHTKSHEVGN